MSTYYANGNHTRKIHVCLTAQTGVRVHEDPSNFYSINVNHVRRPNGFPDSNDVVNENAWVARLEESVRQTEHDGNLHLCDVSEAWK